MNRRHLTVKFIESLRGNGQVQHFHDDDPDQMSVRVAPKGAKGFYLQLRSRTALCPISTPLAEARDIARDWLQQFKRGVDPRPKVQAAIKRAEAQDTVGSALAEYERRKLAGLRTRRGISNTLRRELADFTELPLSALSKKHVLRIVDSVNERGAHRQADALLRRLGHFLRWCVQRDLLPISPLYAVDRSMVVTTRFAPRERVLDPVEVVAVWRAAEKLSYPFGDIVRLLLLIPARRGEVVNMRMREVDLAARTWTVPAERYKSGMSHTTMLSAQAVALLESLPRFTGGDHIFTLMDGSRGFSGVSAHKPKLDRLMAEELRLVDREFKPWRIHDLRRTIRSNLSALRVPDHVSELTLGHARKGLQRIYDQHQYRDEMAEALQAWANQLDRWLRPEDNVIEMHTAR